MAVLQNVAILVAIFAILWGFFSHYWIYIPGIIFNIRYPIAKNRPINWKQSVAISSTLSVQDRDPNIIIILTDDLGYNDISFYGGGLANGKIRTPHIDSIGHNGVSFSQAYAGHATCAPSRAALLTGRYASKIGYEFTPTHPGYVKILGTSSKALRKGIYHENVANDLSVDNMTLPLSEITLGQALKEAGYRTLMIGKWHLGDTNETKPINRGFDETLGFNLLSRFLKYGDPNAVDWRLEDMLDKFIWANIGYAVTKDGGERFEPDMYLTDYFAKEASRAIHANKHNPFFLYFSLTAPHGPIQGQKKDYDILAKYIPDEFNRVYGSVVLAIDNAVGTILQALEDTGLKDNTIVIFTNDNGAPNWVMNPNINQPFRGWKATFFEGGIRVPFFMQWPRVISRGIIVDDPISHIDIFPTMLGATKAGGFDSSNLKNHLFDSSLKHLVSNIDGVNLLPFIAKTKTNLSMNVDVENNEKPHKSLYFRSGHYSAIRVGDWKLQVCGNPNKMWLFNLKDDPSEMKNLAQVPEFSFKLQEMLQYLDEVSKDQSKPLWPSMTETAVHIDKLFEFNESLDDEYIYWPN